MPNALRLITLIVTVGALTACQVLKDLQGGSNQAPTTEAEETTSYNYILSLLEYGQFERAETELSVILRNNPNEQSARLLYDQLKQSPQVRYGREYRQHRVADGESLTKIANNYLGNAMEFVGLARYNNIKVPVTLKRGELIKVPYKVNTPESRLIDRHLNDIELMINDNAVDSFKALSQITPLPWHQKRYKQLIDKASGVSLKQVQTSQTSSLQQSLKSLNTISTSERYLKQSIRSVESQIQASILVNKSREAIAAGNYVEAYKPAAKLKSISKKASTENHQELYQSISENLHREAILLFRKQQINKAVELWQKVLTLTPNHSSASGYLERAKKLLSQLKTIKSD